MPTIMNAIAVIMSNIWGHTPPRVTDPVPTVPVLVRTAAAIHGYCRASRQPPVPATVTGRIPAPAVRPRAKPSMQAATATAMVRGSSIRPVSIGAQVLAETAAQQTMTTLRTA